MPSQENRQPTVVIGAGVIGCATAWSLAREGHRVVLVDRHEPGRGGASFGNAGHIATELVEPVPSLQLLFGFWRELFAVGGPLSIPFGRLPRFAPWARRFAAAAFRRAEHTQLLAPLVKPASGAFRSLLNEIGRPDLLRSHGHYQIWTRRGAARRARAEQRHMGQLGIATRSVPPEVLRSITTATGSPHVAGLWFPESAHVTDPLGIIRALVHAASQCGTVLRKAEVRGLDRCDGCIEVQTETDTIRAGAVVVCAGPWSAPLLRSFGLHAPLEAARGYHIELPGHAAHVDAPVVYMDQRTVVTPLEGRLRATSFMEFEAPDAPADQRKPAHLRRQLQALGYRVNEHGPSWLGSRPVLPDYLPGIGRAPGGDKLFYAIGHQHVGLTLAPITGDLIADLLAERRPRHDVAAFDLRRFGSG